MSPRAARAAVPPGYTRFAIAGSEVVALRPLADALRLAMREGTLYDYAAHHPAARALAGRGVAWAVPLPDGESDVVVRHSRHGGLLAPLTGDRFRAPTRAPHELATALRLTRLGVRTPEVVAYATYPAGALRRADVVTREVPGATDLAAALLEAPDSEARRALLAATAELLAGMSAAGARHPDLNLRNVLIAPDENGAPEAWVIDVDRVWFDEPFGARVMERNLHRFGRSARKWRRHAALPIEDEDLAWLARETAARRGAGRVRA